MPPASARVNRITSVHSRENPQLLAQTALEKGSNLQVAFEGKEISQSLTTSAEIISAAHELIDSYLKIYHPDIVVNRKNNEKYSLQSEQTETPEFKRWFGDSPFVNEDGSPKVYYHGTPYGGFNVFKNRSYYTSAFHLSPDESRPGNTTGAFFHRLLHRRSGGRSPRNGILSLTA